uniref:Transmembrane protein 109 n=1 Tax=Geotrypetes seraphini TaxID=260995 RepID=A0A6P8PK21_GEOSA|nr:transmembrane protein 109 [Geotrypetes seraphini]
MTRMCFPSGSRFLLRVIAAAILSCAIFHIPAASAQKKEAERPGDVLSQGAHTVRQTLEGLLGEELTEQITSALSNLVWMLCSGISAGLTTLSGFIHQLLTVLGVQGEHLTSFLELSPSQVQYILLWALAALIGYWIVSFVLGLALSLVYRTFWLMKVSVFLLAFFYILMMVPETNLRVLFLLGLVGLYALLGRLGSGGPRYDAHVENKLWNLERQVAKLQQNQKRVEKLSKNFDK